MPLETLANVKSRLSISTSADDTLLSLLLDSADRWVAEYCQRDFAGGSFTEFFTGRDAVFVLANRPIAAVVAVRFDPLSVFGVETTVPPSCYVTDLKRGLIRLRNGPILHRMMLPLPGQPPWEQGPLAVRIEYTTATSAVPNDVKQAYAELVGHWYRHAKTQAASAHQNITQQTLGSATVIFSRDQIAGLPLPPDLRDIFDRYRERTV